MSPSPPPRHLLLLILLALFPRLLLASSSFPLPTVAIAAVNTTATSSPHHLACALVPSGTTDYQLSCASITNRSSPPHNYSYGAGAGAGGGNTAFSALVAGDGYLCSASPTASRPMSMRWWDLNDSEEPSKRVYRGKPLSAVSGGGEYVCGIVDEKIQCWRWSSKTFPVSVNFSAVAVGGGFVCGLVKSSGEVRCFVGDGSAATRVEPPKGRHSMLAAGERHACAVRAHDGEIVCWGEAAAVAAASPTTTAGRSVSSLAVGDAVTCVLWGNWTVKCWPPESAAPPESVAQQQFVALEAKGKVVCGVLMSDYSLVCWGSGVTAPASGVVSKVFDRVLPGPCAPLASCRCGVWSGSAPLCSGDGVVCYPCGYSPPMPATVPTSNSSSTPSSHSKRRPSDLVIALVSAGIGSGVLAAIAAVAVVYCLRRRRRVHEDSGHAEPNGGPPAAPRVERRLSALLSKGPNTTVEQFPLASLRAATAGFSQSHRIGSGSFGTVYRASLPDGREVAIKRAEPRRRGGDPASSSSSTAAARRVFSNHEAAFVSELALLSRVNHKNLVRLLGFCADVSERILVYEYMPNGTLHDHLHKRPLPLSPPLASWPARLRLALGAARGIEYMHTYAVPPIIHRDIKSPNILLDSTWTAKVSDFGLSLLNHNLDADEEPCVVTAGTVGYMDPEYYRLQHLTDKSDVYSFGVVLLELMSGCRVVQRYAESVTPKNVVEFAVPHILADDVARVLDPRLPAPTADESEALAYVGYLAADCVGPVGCDRPSMTEVVDALERALAACGAAPLSRAGTARRPVLSRSGTDQFDLTDTD